VIFNDITARDIGTSRNESGVFSFCKSIDTFCPLGPWSSPPTNPDAPTRHATARPANLVKTLRLSKFRQNPGNSLSLFADG